MSAKKKKKKLTGKHKITLYFDEENVMEDVRSCLINHCEQHLAVHEKMDVVVGFNGRRVFHVDLDWDKEDMKITCDYECEYTL